MTTSACSYDGSCSNSNQNQPIDGNIGLPHIIRHDPTMYLKHRDGVPASNTTDIFQSEVMNASASASVNINAEPEPGTSCSLYVARSMVPNSGFGMYAGRDFTQGEPIDKMPQIVLPIDNSFSSVPSFSYDPNSIIEIIVNDYPWKAEFMGMHLEDPDYKMLFPNVGMLANAHLGLFNVKMNMNRVMHMHPSVSSSPNNYNDDDEQQNNHNHVHAHFHVGSKNRSQDFEAGSSSLYHASNFIASAGIEKGSELFLDYGEAYFNSREEMYGSVFPTWKNYRDADAIVGEFVQKCGLGRDHDAVADGIVTKHEQDWKDVVEQLQIEGMNDAEKRRVAFALPKSIDDLEYANEIGTARFSLPEPKRSIEWLEEHGVCMDNLRVGRSNIPHAGFGAFAMNKIKEDSIVTMMPMLPIARKIVEMGDHESSKKGVQHKQLLLNYCFGHPNSSLLLFPYGSSTHFINHSNNPNAFIRWSSHDLSDKSNFQRNAKGVSTGLMMEIVAIGDIPQGGEITIDYGTRWNQAWEHHIESWEVLNGDPVTNPAYTAKLMNGEGGGRGYTDGDGPSNGTSIVRTLDEQDDRPYPDCVRIACYHSKTSGPYIYTEPHAQSLHFCDVVDRYRKGDRYWYDVRVEGFGIQVLTGVPRTSIKFVAGKRCSDMHLQGAFRHEIQVPDEMFPDRWMDLTS